MKTISALFVLCFSSAVAAQQAPRVDASALPVRELTAFKDGHAYLLREAPLAADANGQVVLDELPQPVLGTFWPFASGGAKLVSAKAGRDEVSVKRKAVTLLQLARANVGKVVRLDIGEDDLVGGELLGLPRREGDGELLLVRHKDGTRAIPISRVRDLAVVGEFEDAVEEKQMRERLVLRVDGGGAQAKVGVVYVQKGFRWIPSYRIDIDGSGKAQVQMQATMVNDLVDLEGVTVNLVVGVPKFAFEGMVDPIALQQQAPQVAAANGYGQHAQFSNFLGNSLTTQVSGYGAPRQQPPNDPKVAPGEASEDLFVFPVQNVTLKKGERMIVPITSFELPYRDVYRFDVAMAPPMEQRRNLQDQRVMELAKQLAAPKVRHVLRFENDSDQPLTTAPALVLANGKILAQGHMKYTPRGASTDLEINVAIDVCVETEEHETNRKANVRLSDKKYTRIELTGSVQLHNAKSVPVEIEVVRRVLGLVDEVDGDGAHKQLDLVKAWSDASRPGWWSWWSWPYWWFHHNGFGECRWLVTLKPGEKVLLGARWHYYWR